MTTLNLTPLEHVPAFTEQLRTLLKPYWITSAEEFASLRRTANNRYAHGLAALGAALEIDTNTINILYEACLAASPQAKSYNILTDLDVGDGLVFNDENDVSQAKSYTILPSDLQPTWLLPVNRLPPVLDQGQRNTCVAFTVIAMYQLLTVDPTDLSEQFLFWACKQLDHAPLDGRGTQPQAAVDALKQYGVCRESNWLYDPQSRPNDITHGQPSTVALQEATRRRIISGGSLPSIDSVGVRLALAAGKPVLLGLEYYSFWRDGGQARRGGRIRSPLPGEDKKGGHAVCAVGYRADTNAPGGGYIIFRNSWGTGFGSENNLDGPGYGHIPYDVLDKVNRRAYVIDVPANGTVSINGSEEQSSGSDLWREARSALTRAQNELDRVKSIINRLEDGER